MIEVLLKYEYYFFFKVGDGRESKIVESLILYHLKRYFIKNIKTLT